MTEDKIISELELKIKRAEYVDRDYVDGVDVDLLSSSLELIKRQKEALDAAPVKHCRWIEYPKPHYFKCSNCRMTIAYKYGVRATNGEPKYKYCPNCGAKFDGDVSNVGNN